MTELEKYRNTERILNTSCWFKIIFQSKIFFSIPETNTLWALWTIYHKFRCLISKPNHSQLLRASHILLRNKQGPSLTSKDITVEINKQFDWLIRAQKQIKYLKPSHIVVNVPIFHSNLFPPPLNSSKSVETTPNTFCPYLDMSSKA